MTNEESIAQRYAQAIFDLGLESGGGIHTLADEIGRFAAAFEASPELRAIAGNPLVTEQAREQVVIEVSDRLALSRLAKNALGLMTRRQRLPLVPMVATELGRLADERSGVARATVTSASPLSDGYCQRLQASLERITGKKVVLDRKVDPTLVAGVVTRIGDRVIDGSARARLAAIRSQLLSTSS
jgi:F-type H+-transporting ATPase subunit delta